MKNILLQILAVILFAPLVGVHYSFSKEDPIKPYGVVPTKDQIDWQRMEYYMFIHFGPNTFTNVEWGDGKEDPKVFNPTDVDCRQWAATAKAAGMKAIIITAKHHDGFCLWPSKFSAHTVRESLWKEGKGDILKELSEACREYGLKFGVYLSPWDQNHPAYGTPEYNQIFSNTLNEVLSNYGSVFEQWFDGANGEGKDGKKQVYDWNLFHETVYRNQPQAIIFSDVGPGCRWMGNEGGVAGETNWSTLNIDGFEPGRGAPSTEILNKGDMGGQAWVPAETDVSIRPGWFYSPSTDDKVKLVEKLKDIYYTSIGRNSNLLLNVPPDRRGRIHPNDSTRLVEFRKAIDEDFSHNLVQGASVKASDIRDNNPAFSPANLFNDNYDAYWAVNDNILDPFVEIDFNKKQTINRLLLQEYIPLGQRVSSFVVKYWDDVKNDWTELTQATTIGYKRILRFPSITTQKVRIEIQALACPVISTVGIYKSEEQLSAPLIERSKEGLVTIKCETPDPSIYYTIDGEEPNMSSNKYNKPFNLLNGGDVKTIAVIDNGSKKSEVVTASYDVAPVKWSVVSSESLDLSKVIDGNNHTSVEIDKDKPLVIDMKTIYTIKGFSYTPSQKVQTSNIYKYNFYVSIDGKKWTEVKNNGVFDNIANNPVKQDVLLNKSIKARYIKIVPLETVNGDNKYIVAEVGIITR